MASLPGDLPTLNSSPTAENDSSVELHHLQSDKTSITMNSSEIAPTSTPTSIDGILDITLHHANDIHNICIYGKQDVYAKFSITQTQDTVYSTQPVRGGGKNPVFNQSLQILISKLDSVLKCELWMMSCARNYLEDQMLGFVLVPLGNLLAMGKLTRDYALSSTELFHTHAGTVCLSLLFYERGAEPLFPTLVPKKMQAETENGGHGGMRNAKHNLMENDVLMENGNDGTKKGKYGDMSTTLPVDYDSIEFPDLQVASENQHLVSMYLKMGSHDFKMDGSPRGDADSEPLVGGARKISQALEHVGNSSLLRGSFPRVEEDCEMAVNNGEEELDACNGSSDSASNEISMVRDAEGSCPSTIPISQTVVAVADEVSELKSKPSRSIDVPITSTTHLFGCSSSSQSPRSVSSGGVLSSSDDKTASSSDGLESLSSFAAPLVSISLAQEEPVVQQQIVDMYMKSMQQFTESLAKMKLPFDLDGVQNRIQPKSETQPEKKGASSESMAKDGTRVFYGSRAFF